MNEATVDLFVEDRAHEELLKALLTRLGRDEGKQLVVRPRSARGGHGRALLELDLYQRAIVAQGPLPDLLVVCIDGNCERLTKAREEVVAHLRPGIADRTVVACPDPHVERWYLADPVSFNQVVGSRPSVGRKKCERGRYKEMLARAVRDAGHPATLGGVEFAREIADAMDLYGAGKNDRSLRLFLGEARSKIRQLAVPR